MPRKHSGKISMKSSKKGTSISITAATDGSDECECGHNSLTHGIMTLAGKTGCAGCEDCPGFRPKKAA